MGFYGRVSDVWSAIVGRPSQRVLSAQSELIGAKREIAALELELSEARDTLERQRKRIEESESDHPLKSADHLEALFANLAAPLSQLRMQSSLMESGKEISSRSVMALVRSLMEMVENAGLEPIGTTGTQISFDPTICEPLSADSSFANGETVIVRFVGYRYQGKIQRKALVERSR